MGKTRNERNIKKIRGQIFFCLFVLLVMGGILVKRVYHHPEFMMMFHLPAAVFLILAGHDLPAKLWKRYEQDCNDIRQEIGK